MELGCGKGRFTAETAAAEPDVLLIAVEKVPDAMVVAMERARDAGLHNVFFVDGDAALPAGLLRPRRGGPASISTSAIPWPKSNQKKRRLTHGNFLQLYRRVLRHGRRRSTSRRDNDKLFEWSLEEIPQFGFRLSGGHAGTCTPDGPVGVMTDYEAQVLSARASHHQPLRGHHGPLGGPCTAGGAGRSVTPERRTRA